MVVAGPDVGFGVLQQLLFLVWSVRVPVTTLGVQVVLLQLVLPGVLVVELLADVDGILSPEVLENGGLYCIICYGGFFILP